LSKQIREAIVAYFQEDLKESIGDPYWVPLNEEQANKHAKAAAESMSAETDNCLKKIEVSDHCVHWVADLTVMIDDHEEVIEVPFNRVDATVTHTLQIYEFLTALVKSAVAESGATSMMMSHVHKVAMIIDEAIERCEGCSANIHLDEVIFSGELKFRFSVNFSSPVPDVIFSVSFDIPWPLK
jgi:hypothetical protein